MSVRWSVAGCWCGIIAETAVYRHVSPLAVSELRSAPDALADEPGLFQRPLLGEVLHVGSGLDPVRGGSREQVPGQQPAPRARVTEAVPVKGSRDARVYRQLVKHRQVGLPDGAQMDRRHSAMMADGLPARCRGLPKHARADRNVLNSA